MNMNQLAKKKSRTTTAQRKQNLPSPWGRVESSSQGKIFTTTLVMDLGVLTSSITTDRLFSFSFTLGALPGSASYQQVFDQYRFDLIEFELYPLQTVNPVLGTSVLAPVLYSALDYDDDIVLLTLPAIREYGTCQTHKPLTTIRRTFRPNIAINAFASTGNAYVSRPAEWLDIAYNSVQHYGVKIGMETASGLVDYRGTGKVKVSFKLSR